MLQKKWYALTLVCCFLGGAYLWKVTRTTIRPIASSTSTQSNAIPPGILVYVGDEPITSEDVEFEYDLHTRGVFDADGVTPIPDVGVKMEKQLNPLKERLLTAMIERKLLYLSIKQDHRFPLDNPARFTACLSEWQQTDQSKFSVADKERLKERLCERSIVEQYMKEVIFANLRPNSKDIKEYYEKNRKNFIKPRRILIRQIVVATEKEAEEAKKGLTRSNFAERARQISIAPEAEKGGLVGPFAQGELPKFFDYAFGMAKGEIYGIIKSTYGFHIIMLEERYNKTEETLQQAQAEVNDLLVKEMQQKEYKKWIEAAINTVPVKTPGSKSF